MDYKQLPDEVSLKLLLEEKLYKPIRKFKQDVRNFKQQVKDWIGKNWFKLAFLGVCLVFAIQKDLNLNINFNSSGTEKVQGFSAQATSLSLSDNLTSKKATNSNKPFLSPAALEVPAKKKRKPIVMTEKTKKQLAYVKRFASVAQAEMEKYGIPASVTLAQGLIETNAGQSPLARKNNNHFGMKCFSRKCRKGHCSNFSDDSHKDFFRIYKSSWESFRAHSKLLIGKRYKHLLELDKTDYKNWAKGLKKAGYATDKTYDKKLIRLIEDLYLYDYDL